MDEILEKYLYKIVETLPNTYLIIVKPDATLKITIKTFKFLESLIRVVTNLYISMKTT